MSYDREWHKVRASWEKLVARATGTFWLRWLVLVTSNLGSNRLGATQFKSKSRSARSVIASVPARKVSCNHSLELCAAGKMHWTNEIAIFVLRAHSSIRLAKQFGPMLWLESPMLWPKLNFCARRTLSIGQIEVSLRMFRTWIMKCPSMRTVHSTYKQYIVGYMKKITKQKTNHARKLCVRPLKA